MIKKPYWGIVIFVIFAPALVANPSCSCGIHETTDGDGNVDSSSDPGADFIANDNRTDFAADNGDGNGNGNRLTGTLRDFMDTHPDFEDGLAVDPGIVEEELGADGKPVYAGGSGTLTTHGREAFDQWYRDVDGVNMSTPFTIELTGGAGGVYTYDNPAFFPIDDQLFGNQGREHNYHFTYEIHTRFKYNGGEVFQFTGDDDLWVFVNGHLAIDLGGVHSPISGEVVFDEQASTLGITPGNYYTLDFFFAERHTVQSNFRIDTTIDEFIII
jgi:fibro-slime domain-containing protein